MFPNKSVAALILRVMASYLPKVAYFSLPYLHLVPPLGAQDKYLQLECCPLVSHFKTEHMPHGPIHTGLTLYCFLLNAASVITKQIGHSTQDEGRHANVMMQYGTVTTLVLNKINKHINITLLFSIVQDLK